MVLQKDVKMDGLIAPLPFRKGSGGQKKNRGALCQDRRSQNFFSVNNLVTLFLRFPARPLHWNVLQEIEGADGHAETRAGVVMTWAECDGVFVWTIKLSDGQSLVLKCEDLAEAANRACVFGLDVTTRIELYESVGEELKEVDMM